MDGKPFFPIGGQSCNSSGYNATEADQAFKVTKMINGNTLEIPVYWENIEPKEGKFDFTAVDELLAGARRYEIKLILLWFASWKNGNMDYAADRGLKLIPSVLNGSNRRKRQGYLGSFLALQS